MAAAPSPRDDRRVTPQPRAAAETRREWRLALVISICAGLLRLAVAGTTPVFPDETYYWDWSRHLASGYFDHPPMIAWLVRLGTLVAGDTALGVRLGPVLAGTVGAVALAAAAGRTGGARAALVASIAFAAMPLAGAGLILATPDAPLLMFVAIAMYGVVRALEHESRSALSTRWWAAAGAALGLATASKYTAVLFPLGVFLALLSRPDLRVRLKEPGPYVATAVSLVAFAPVILWNARHDWASFAFQLRHGLAPVSGSWFNRELELLGGQLGLVSPILFVLMAVAVAASLRSGDGARRVLAIASLAVFVFFMYSATKRRVEANWPALAYVPGTLLLASHLGGRRWNRWWLGGVALAGVLTLVAYVNAFTPILPVPARRDPAARAYGWVELAQAVSRQQATPTSGARTWIAGDRYQETAALAFHLAEHPQTFSLNLSGRPNQYDFWSTFAESARAGDALVLAVDDVEGVHPTVQRLTQHFDRVTKGEPVVLSRKGDPVKYLRLWRLDGWRGSWPTVALASRR